MELRRRSSSARWPFWLLLAAWVCANSPQVAVYAVVTWIAEARSFSHQHELTRSVAHLLKGETSASQVAVVMQRARAGVPAQPLPPVPPEAVMKKLPLSLERVATFVGPTETTSRCEAEAVRVPAWIRPAPPLGPPRAAAA